MGQFDAVAVSTPRSTPGAARGSLLGALVSASMAIAALSSAGVADATCTSVSGTRWRALHQHSDLLRGQTRQKLVGVGPGPLQRRRTERQQE
jgi:hypothetical protein